MARDTGALVGPGSPSPVLLEGDDPAVLAIHGFGGTPHEVALVIDVAKELGLRAHAPLLPGHGTNSRELAKTGWDEWAKGAEFALDSVLRPGRTAIVVGLSLGSLLAIHLADKRRGEVRALGLLANATRLTSPFPDWALRLIDRLPIPDFALPKAGADIADPHARATHLTYGNQPVRAAVEVLRAGERMEKRLPEIRVPTFVAHGKDDHVCPVANAERVRASLGSRDTTVLVLPRSRHIITRDYDRELLKEELRRFIERVARDRVDPVAAQA